MGDAPEGLTGRELAAWRETGRTDLDLESLQFIDGWWRYLRRVPTDLVTSVGKSFVRKKLRTRSVREAMKKRDALNVETDALFAGVAGGADRANAMASFDRAVKIAQ